MVPKSPRLALKTHHRKSAFIFVYTASITNCSMAPTRKDMRNEERAAVLEELLCRSSKGTLQHGALAEATQLHNVDPRTIP